MIDQRMLNVIKEAAASVGLADLVPVIITDERMRPGVAAYCCGGLTRSDPGNSIVMRESFFITAHMTNEEWDESARRVLYIYLHEAAHFINEQTSSYYCHGFSFIACFSALITKYERRYSHLLNSGGAGTFKSIFAKMSPYDYGDILSYYLSKMDDPHSFRKAMEDVGEALDVGRRLALSSVNLHEISDAARAEENRWQARAERKRNAKHREISMMRIAEWFISAMGGFAIALLIVVFCRYIGS